MTQYCRQNRRYYDHPRNRTPEVGQELEEGVGLLLRNFVRAVLSQALLCFGLAEAVRGVLQTLLEFCQRQVPQLSSRWLLALGG